jgi:hypothetical protein
MVDGHYFEIGTTVHSSNWNSTSSGFNYATHFGVAARVVSPAIQGIVAARGMALAFGYTVFCACSGSCASLKR